MINSQKILTDANNASSNIFLYSSFVSSTEFILNDKNLKIINKDKYKDCWNEMEILNAIALAEWEDDGKPLSWEEKWKAIYQNDAKNLITNFLKNISSI